MRNQIVLYSKQKDNNTVQVHYNLSTGQSNVYSWYSNINKRNAYYQKNKKVLQNKHAIYRQEHRKESVAYRQRRKKETQIYNAVYRQEHKDAIAIYNATYRQNHAKEIATYQQTKAAKQSNIKKQAKRKRNLGWVLLFPNPFADSILIDYHHVTDTYVVAIPRDLHRLYLGKYHREKVMEIVKQIYL